jgi:hypothetical protein
VTVIQNQLVPAQVGGTARDVDVTVRLRAAHGVLDDGQHEVPRVPPVTVRSAAGFWSVDLVPSAEYEDTGAYYEVQEGTQRWTVLVPDAGGPYWLREVLSDPPPAAGPVLGLTQTQGDARYQQLTGRGAANGYASLDGTGKVPVGQLPPGSGGGGVTDHGDLTGLTPDDDHPQYLTAGRGDARYDAAGTAGTAVAAHAAAADPHPTYLTAAEGAAAYDPLGAHRRHVAGPTYVTAGAGGGNTNPNTGGAWQQLTGPGELAVPAVAGDRVECTVRFLSQDSGGSTYDLAILNAGALVWFASSGGAAPALEGDPAMYPQSGALIGKTGMAALTVGAGHIDVDGAVHWVLAIRTTGANGLTYYSALYPFRWAAINHGQPAP